MDKNKFTEYDKVLVSELKKLNISPQTFDKMCEISADFSKKHKELADTNYSVYYILMLAVVYNAGLKGGAVL